MSEVIGFVVVGAFALSTVGMIAWAGLDIWRQTKRDRTNGTDVTDEESHE